MRLNNQQIAMGEQKRPLRSLEPRAVLYPGCAARSSAQIWLAIAKPIFEPLTLAGVIAHCGRGAALRGRYILSIARLAPLKVQRGLLGLAADALSLGGDLLGQPLKFLLELGHGCSPSLILRARFLEGHKQQKRGIWFHEDGSTT
jgi:hypothetical protein